MSGTHHSTEHPAVTMARDEATSQADDWTRWAASSTNRGWEESDFLADALEAVSAALRTETARREAVEAKLERLIAEVNSGTPVR